MPNHPWLRRVLALLAVPLLAAPSAYGVYTYLEPQSGAGAAVSAAVGFELLYIGVNVLMLHTEELRRYGRNVALCAVATAVVFNTLAHYRLTVPDIAHTPVDAAALGLALLGSLPLAGLAYATSVLLHRLTERVNPLQPMVDSLQAQLTQALDERNQVASALDALRNAAPVLVDAPQPRLAAPLDTRPDILRWKDDEGLTFEAIGERLSISRQAAQARYNKVRGEERGR